MPKRLYNSSPHFHDLDVDPLSELFFSSSFPCLLFHSSQTGLLASLWTGPLHMLSLLWNAFSRYLYVSSSYSGFTQYYLLIEDFPGQYNTAASSRTFCPASLFYYFVLLSLYCHSQIMLVSLGCCNKEPQTIYLKTTDIYSTTVLEAKSPKSSCQ